MLLVSYKVIFIKNEATMRLCYYALLCGNVQGHLQLQSNV